MSWNKTHSKNLEEKASRLKIANHSLREELKQRDKKKIKELEETVKIKDDEIEKLKAELNCCIEHRKTDVIISNLFLDT